jgi:hypothetical protein
VGQAELRCSSLNPSTSLEWIRMRGEGRISPYISGRRQLSCDTAVGAGSRHRSPFHLVVGFMWPSADSLPPCETTVGSMGPATASFRRTLSLSLCQAVLSSSHCFSRPQEYILRVRLVQIQLRLRSSFLLKLYQRAVKNGFTTEAPGNCAD